MGSINPDSFFTIIISIFYRFFKQNTETVFVADKEGTFSNLKPDYLLTNGNALTLDASKHLLAGDYDTNGFMKGFL